MTERIDSNKTLEGTDDEVEIKLLINIECTVIVIEPVSPIRNTPHSTSPVFCETNQQISNKIQSHPQNSISNKKIHLHVFQFILYSNFGGFNPTPKYF